VCCVAFSSLLAVSSLRVLLPELVNDLVQMQEDINFDFCACFAQRF
jgi:hypothetical protein